MSVSTKDNRFQVENQTHYNTDDLIAILDFFVSNESTGDDINRWTRVPPRGALIQFVEFNGNDRFHRSAKYNKDSNDWEFVNERIYVLSEDTKMWHVVKIVPPSRIFPNELEALSADMTKVPGEMYLQIVRRIMNMLPTTVRYFEDKQDFPDGFEVGQIRIETERQAKRRAATRRPEQLYNLREKERLAASELSGATSRLTWTAGKIHTLSEDRVKLGLSDVTNYANEIERLYAQLKVLASEFQSLTDNTPTA